MRSFVEMARRPYREPQTRRHYAWPELICMDWQQGQTLSQLEVVEVPFACVVKEGPYR